MSFGSLDRRLCPKVTGIRRRNKTGPRNCIALVLAALLPFAPTAGFAKSAPMSEAAAPELVERYIKLHNEHRLDDVMAVYGNAARFQLNAGRELVTGKDAIRELERFDVFAGSHLRRRGLQFEQDGDSWLVHIAGVTERSQVFDALGMRTVRTRPVRRGFVLRGGLIVAVMQPDLNPACARIARAGFTGLTTWLADSRYEHSRKLFKDGRLVFQPEHIPSIILAIEEWREASGWRHPTPELRSCEARTVPITEPDQLPVA